MSDHFRALEALYASAPINDLFVSKLHFVGRGHTRIEFEVSPRLYHAAGAAHGTVYFKMLDDAAFYAANSLVEDVFVLTTAFNIFLTRPIHEGKLVAEGRWLSGERRVLIAESRLIASSGEEVGRGTGTFMRSRIALDSLDAYATVRRA